MIPGLIFSTLHTRDFITFDEEGSEEWKRQLRVWRHRDIAVWVLGILYCVFCLFFVAVFIANVTEKDRMSWSIALLLSFVQGHLLIPSIVSTFFVLMVAISSCFHEVRKRVRHAFSLERDDIIELRRPASKWSSPKLKSRKNRKYLPITASGEKEGEEVLAQPPKMLEI